MTSRHTSLSHYATAAAAASVLGVFCLQSAHTETADADAAAHKSWRTVMARHKNAEPGCYRATYPSMVWEKIECKEGNLPVPSAPRHTTGVRSEVTGDGNDYVAESAGLITETVGTFPSVSGIKGEKTIGVAAFGGGGVLGPNEYTLQINTNVAGPTASCAGRSGCYVWQQFAYGTNFPYPNQKPKFNGVVFIEYWLINWGSPPCPHGWRDYGGSCVRNSSYTEAPNAPIKDTGLQDLTLSGSAVAGGNDTVVFNNGTTAYSVTEPDSMLDLSSVWTQSEFNVFGDGDGSEAVFNKGSSLTVNLALTDGSNAAPTCVGNAGTTGESNNLNLGACTATGGASPSIQFTEAN
jgi:hypothetical protein